MPGPKALTLIQTLPAMEGKGYDAGQFNLSQVAYCKGVKSVRPAKVGLPPREEDRENLQ
jgi:hypothetical protein